MKFFSWLTRLLLGPEDDPVPPVVGYEGRSYRQELLRLIVRLNEKVEKDPDPDTIKALQKSLRDLHDLEYSAAQSEATELRAGLDELRARLEQVEGLINVRRVEPPSGHYRRLA